MFEEYEEPKERSMPYDPNDHELRNHPGFEQTKFTFWDDEPSPSDPEDE